MTTTIEFITALFSEVDEQLRAIPKHPEAHLWPSEVVTLGLLHALKGVGNRPFYRWLTRDYLALFPRLPERTRLFRLLKTHQDWRIGKINGIFAPVSPGVHPWHPTTRTSHRLWVPLPALASRLADLVGQPEP